MEATSIDKLVAHCQSAKFTGILRMRAREGIGEVWFLSGVADEVHFGTSTADEAMDRMRKANDATYELVARLPHPGGGFKGRFPAKGSIATATPVTLMRYSEQYALTCTLAVESGDVLVEARYEMGELVSVETTADDDGITAMLEAKEGTYEFTLPHVELPAGTPVLPPASTSLMESLPPPESLGFRALLETKPTTGRPPSDEAEVKRKTVEIAHKTATASKPVTAPPPKVVETKKEEARPVAKAPAKVAAATPRASPPRPTPSPTAAVKAKEEAKPAAAPVEEKKTEAQKEEAKPVAEPAEPAKEEAKPAATPVEEEKREEPVEPVKAAKAPTKSESAEKPLEAPPARSLSWLAIPLLLAVVVIYLYWINRM